MYQDSYFPNNLVDKLREIIKETVNFIEEGNHTDVVEQMPFIKKRFLSCKSFAAATIDELFTGDELKGALKRNANYFSSSFIRNNGNETFTMEPLPDVSQYSVINEMVPDDFDGDGNLDICINTNDYGTEPRNGRYDALNGVVSQSYGKGNFVPLSILQGGIYISGNGKGLVKLKQAGSKYLVVAAQNRAL